MTIKKRKKKKRRRRSLQCVSQQHPATGLN